MLFIWKPPALQILICSIFAPLALLACTLPFKPSDKVGALLASIAVLIYGGSVVIADCMHRRDENMGVFSTAQSTIFFIIPTWIIGAPFALAGLIATVISLIMVIFG